MTVLLCFAKLYSPAARAERYQLPGVYGGFVDKIPMGAFMNKGLTMKTGQTHMMRYMKPLLERVQNGDIDPSFVISHHVSIDEAPEAYRMFRDKKDNCTKVVLDPWAEVEGCLKCTSPELRTEP